MDGYTHEDISKKIGIGMPAVKSLVSAAFKTIREKAASPASTSAEGLWQGEKGKYIIAEKTESFSQKEPYILERSVRSRMTKSESEIFDLYSQGLSAKEIAAKRGSSSQAVSEILRQLRSKKIISEDSKPSLSIREKKAYDLRCSGKSSREISSALGISIGNVDATLSRARKKARAAGAKFSIGEVDKYSVGSMKNFIEPWGRIIDFQPHQDPKKVRVLVETDLDDGIYFDDGMRWITVPKALVFVDIGNKWEWPSVDYGPKGWGDNLGGIHPGLTLDAVPREAEMVNGRWYGRGETQRYYAGQRHARLNRILTASSLDAANRLGGVHIPERKLKKDVFDTSEYYRNARGEREVVSKDDAIRAINGLIAGPRADWIVEQAANGKVDRLSVFNQEEAARLVVVDADIDRLVEHLEKAGAKDVIGVDMSAVTKTIVKKLESRGFNVIYVAKESEGPVAIVGGRFGDGSKYVATLNDLTDAGKDVVAWTAFYSERIAKTPIVSKELTHEGGRIGFANGYADGPVRRVMRRIVKYLDGCRNVGDLLKEEGGQNVAEALSRMAPRYLSRVAASLETSGRNSGYHKERLAKTLADFVETRAIGKRLLEGIEKANAAVAFSEKYKPLSMPVDRLGIVENRVMYGLPLEDLKNGEKRLVMDPVDGMVEMTDLEIVRKYEGDDILSGPAHVVEAANRIVGPAYDRLVGKLKGALADDRLTVFIMTDGNLGEASLLLGSAFVIQEDLMGNDSPKIVVPIQVTATKDPNGNVSLSFEKARSTWAATS